VRKSIKNCISYDERWILKQITNNPKLRATKLAAKNHLHKKVNSETVRGVLRKNDFHRRMTRKKAFISQKNQKFRMELIIIIFI
jgi:hypothetical protein